MAQPVWNTTAGTIGSYPATIATSFTFSASPVSPATSLTYTVISGSLPVGLSLASNGILSGTPAIIDYDTTYTFVVRAKDNLNNIRDRTFTITISSISVPKFTTPSGQILNAIDSDWVSLQIQYYNPISTNLVTIRKVQGELPPGLEINDYGIIRGYPTKPVQLVNYPEVTTIGYQTYITSNKIRVYSTTGMVPGRPIIFTGSVLSDLVDGAYYYVKEVFNSTEITVSSTINGPEVLLDNDTGVMDVTLPATSVNQPIKITYNFTLKLESELGIDYETYSITVTNQNLPVSEGGSGALPGTRSPVIFNTRPQTYNIENTPEFRYYVLPNNTGETYLPSENAYIGRIESNNFFSFKILGHDFDGDNLTYEFVNLPSDFTGDNTTGWITGSPNLSANAIAEYNFSVFCKKTSAPSYYSEVINFSAKISQNITGNITWITDSDLGTVLNGSISTLKVVAESDIPLQYRLVSGTIPGNLTLTDTGELIGNVSYEPGTSPTTVDTTNDFSFTIEAYSPSFFIVSSTKTFTLSITQTFAYPTDSLYIQASPSIDNRVLLDGLLSNTTIFPSAAIYRPEDSNFGLATSVIYQHAFGIDPAVLDEYIAAVTRNHYWRNLTLGEIKTAVAKDDNGEVIYEVVYSQIIDNLINPYGVSIEQSITWPRLIDLNLGPWYTSSISIYSSYVLQNNQQYYTSLTPGYVSTLYPNSTVNMRTRIENTIGSVDNYRLLPRWMTSQQSNGSTLGFTPAWVICYTKPGFADTIKNNINTLWVDSLGNQLRLNQINFQIDRFTVNKIQSYNYDSTLVPASWLSYPGADPVPNPTDSENFYVLFPRQTILPTDIENY